MRALIQRVSSASVSTREGNVNSIDQGFCILLGVGPDDTEEIAEKLWSKISKLRIFEDQDGKTNLSLRDVSGAVLLVSQFTLYADCRKGNRPSFTKSAFQCPPIIFRQTAGKPPLARLPFSFYR